MFEFREQTPSRRANRSECKNYRSYNKSLREDFNKRCGYCNDSDKWRIRSFTIDHFIPQNPDGFYHTIKANYYYNLVYSCSYCNAAKSNKWPTNNPELHNNGVVGFLEATSEEYTKLFKRDFEGSLVAADPKNQLAASILKELQLWLPIHSNMWKLERIKILSRELKTKIATIEDESLKKEITNLHFLILQEMEEIQNNIFVENE